MNLPVTVRKVFNYLYIHITSLFCVMPKPSSFLIGPEISKFKEWFKLLIIANFLTGDFISEIIDFHQKYSEKCVFCLNKVI